MKYIINLVYCIILIFPVICFSETNNDFWRVKTNVYMEIEEYQGQHDKFKNKVYDKISTVGQLSLSNPESLWRFDLEHRESMRNHGRNFSTSRDSYLRSRTQLDITKQFVKTAKSDLEIGARYRKESNDAHPDTKSRSSNSMYALTPAGNYRFNNQWSFDFWLSYYYYSNYFNSNSHEAETELGVTYKYSDTLKAKLALYYDKAWDKNFSTRFIQSQIRAYLPFTLTTNWHISPYIRYTLQDETYDKNFYLVQKINNGFRLGTNVEYQATPSLTLWGGIAYEPSTWKNPKDNGMTSGDSNKQTLYIGKIGVKYRW
ncbi:autotransporter outer membrane beta-barrel domain-containing protein [Providencia rettgeri]|uniref:autotransporter outer membrane beta-barrel domain-containing protein n=1 Tax=Providencia rettgeri TaxID=587 RepID=UPI0034E06017